MSGLRVELYGHHVGSLIGSDWRTFDFHINPDILEHFELGSTALSESIPLVVRPNRRKAARRRNFFAELLPEGRVLINLAASIGVPEYDVIALLAQYGRDVAGAVQIYDPDRPGEPRTPRANPLSTQDVRDLLHRTQDFPLGNLPVSGKTSLAGVQDKIVLAQINGVWHQVEDGYPSTHIIKPISNDLPTIIFDEEYGARAAQALGLSDTATWLHDFDGVTGLVIERYDRSSDMPLGRIHQEDMNQVLGARAHQKYQEYGGKVSLRHIAEVLGKSSETDSLKRLLILTVLSVAIGNVDMHAKNVSLLHYPDGRATLAPAYDVVPMRHQRNDGRMALAINGIYPHAQITTADLIAEAQSWRMRDPKPIIEETLEKLIAFTETNVPNSRAYPNLQDDVVTFTRRLLNGQAAGNPG